MPVIHVYKRKRCQLSISEMFGYNFTILKQFSHLVLSNYRKAKVLGPQSQPASNKFTIKTHEGCVVRYRQLT